MGLVIWKITLLEKFCRNVPTYLKTALLYIFYFQICDIFTIFFEKINICIGYCFWWSSWIKNAFSLPIYYLININLIIIYLIIINLITRESQNVAQIGKEFSSKHKVTFFVTFEQIKYWNIFFSKNFIFFIEITV